MADQTDRRLWSSSTCAACRRASSLASAGRSALSLARWMEARGVGSYRSLVQGDTDSERYFALITKETDAHGATSAVVIPQPPARLVPLPAGNPNIDT